METHEALHRLLLTLFSPAEFRVWLRHGPDGAELVAALPDGAPAAILMSEAVALLERRGHLGAAFFARLRADFPRRIGDIVVVESGWASESLTPPSEDGGAGASGPSSGISIQGVRGDVVLHVGRDLVGVHNSSPWGKRRR